ncbi:MAG TPA: ABC transporter permease, partial [Alloiococcus sp.]|nr:ABC transporter permease [Alloiococcus sp.]
MKQILTVAKQVFLKNIKSWGFYLMVLGPILFMVIMGLVGYFMSEDNMDSDETNQTTVALVSEDPAMEEYFSVLNNEDSPLEMTTDYSNAKEAEKAYNDDDIQGFVTVDTNETPVSATVHHNGELSTHLPAIHQVLSQVQRDNAATQIGLTEAELGQLNTPAVMEESDIEVKDTAEGDAEDGVDPLQLGVSYIVTILLFFFISFYSGMICEEIATEKGSRVMEVILSSITATQHFFGKLLGLAFTILVHISLYIVLGGLAFFGINQLFEENLLAFLTDIIDFKAII